MECISRCSREIDPEEAAKILRKTRPTAVNLAWAIERQGGGDRAGHNGTRRKARLRARQQTRLRMRIPEHCRQRLDSTAREVNPPNRARESMVNR